MNDNTKPNHHELTTVIDMVNTLATLTPDRAEVFFADLREALSIGAHLKSSFNEAFAELGQGAVIQFDPLSSITWIDDDEGRKQVTMSVDHREPVVIVLDPGKSAREGVHGEA